jgi:hypothetical protein
MLNAERSVKLPPNLIFESRCMLDNRMTRPSLDEEELGALPVMGLVLKISLLLW